MKQFIEAVEKSIENENWYGALVVALTLPDMAGWVDDPRKGSHARYTAWFEEFVLPTYKRPVGPNHVIETFLPPGDCYALRCAILHEGRDETTDQRARDVLKRFQFVVPPKGSEIHCNLLGNKLQLQVDIFCRDMCQGAQQWLQSIPIDDRDRQNRLSQMIVIHVGPVFRI